MSNIISKYLLQNFRTEQVNQTLNILILKLLIIQYTNFDTSMCRNGCLYWVDFNFTDECGCLPFSIKCKEF